MEAPILVALAVARHRFGVLGFIPSWALTTLAALSVARALLSLPPKFPTPQASADNAVLITGAAGGIGKHAALAFVAKGFHVFAGVRKEADAEMLREAAGHSPLMAPLMLDITRADHIQAAVRDIRASGKHLVVLINNAARATSGPMEIAQDMEDLFESNVFATVRLTNALLPLVREAQGRVVFISSVAGLLSGIANGVYASTKHALEAVADAYRHELGFQNIPVSLIEPGFVETNMPRGVLARMVSWRDQYKNVSTDILDLYERPIRAYEKQAINFVNTMITTTESTTAAILEASLSPRPRPRYLVGLDAHILTTLSWILPDVAFDRIGRLALGI